MNLDAPEIKAWRASLLGGTPLAGTLVIFPYLPGSVPPPFVLQTSLDDNYVAYEHNACISQPGGKQKIASEMHSHIQDCFRKAGIVIRSPHDRADPVGSTPAILDVPA